MQDVWTPGGIKRVWAPERVTRDTVKEQMGQMKKADTIMVNVLTNPDNKIGAVALVLKEAGAFIVMDKETTKRVVDRLSEALERMPSQEILLATGDY